MIVTKDEIEQRLFEELVKRGDIPFEFQLDFVAKVLLDLLNEKAAFKSVDKDTIVNFLEMIRSDSIDSEMPESARLVKVFYNSSLALHKLGTVVPKK